MDEAFSIATKIPLTCNLVLAHGKVFTCNVMSGRKLSLCHSVKHYEAISLNCCFISGGKDRYFYEMIGYFVAKSLIFLRKFGKTTANLEKSRIFAKK